MPSKNKLRAKAPVRKPQPKRFVSPPAASHAPAGQTLPGANRSLDGLNRLFRYGWVVLALAILGGATGLLVQRLRPPVYVARAVFLASIDFNKIDFLNPPKPTPAPYRMTQSEEDIDLSAVEEGLKSVEPQVVKFARKNQLSLESPDPLQAFSIVRRHAYWDVRYRSADPALAQKMADEWAQLGLAELQRRQKNGSIKPYIYLQLIQHADVPDRPTYSQTNVFVLAGALIGFALGALWVSLPPWRPGRSGNTRSADE
jgi:uncharacterized protein involved in exopolysaccharide biosynthesis